MTAPHRVDPAGDMAEILALIRDGFAPMAGRIDPPSSMYRLTAAQIARQAADGEVWAIGTAPPVACIFLTPQHDALYLGKIAVAAQHRHRGLARALVRLAEDRARARGLPRLRLQTRVELTENHATFAALGFVQVGTHAHPGYDRPTSLVMEREVSP